MNKKLLTERYAIRLLRVASSREFQVLLLFVLFSALSLVLIDSELRNEDPTKQIVVLLVVEKIIVFSQSQAIPNIDPDKATVGKRPLFISVFLTL